VLGATSDADIGLYTHGGAPAVPLDAPAVSGEAEDVRRSEFLKRTGAALASVLAPPLVNGWPGGHTAARSVDDAALARLRAQTEGFRWMDRREGAAGLLPHTTDHARWVTACWRSTTDPGLRILLAETAADTCHLVAYQAFDQGQRTSAIEWYRCAAELAVHAKNQELYVFALCGVAYMHARNGEPLLSLSVLRQMSELALTPTSRYYIAVYEAHAYSAAHEEHQALHALDHAVSLAEQESHPAPAPWLGVPDPLFVERQRGMILADLGADSGMDVLSWLDRQTSATFQRYRITLLTDRARLYARQGEPERSADLLAQAIRRNVDTRSHEKFLRMLDVRAALRHHDDTGIMRELDEQLDAYAPTPLVHHQRDPGRGPAHLG
jgi:tetratricopeptide (TPR) repeat protein